VADKKDVLNVPDVESVRYKRNLIEIAVCELRFPTILELENNPPVKLQAKLRKNYPHYEPQERLKIGTTERIPSQHLYLFRSKKKTWTVSIHSGAISLETTSYTEFEEFYERLMKLLEESKSIIDSDFFTRIGLRYINTIPIEDGDLNGWINPALVSILTEGPYGQLQKCDTEVRGYTNVGNYTFRHGIKNMKDEKISEYALDFDYYTEDVEYSQVDSLINQFNTINFSFFDWCLGPKSREFLGEGTAKKK
jgi:uncharacterized protein (TIGR04255 family)